MKGDDISERFLDFAVRIIRLVQALPKNFVGKHVGGQLVRCGTSGGSNYEEARGAESKPDFIHKMSVSWKETRESCYWLRIVQKAQLVRPSRVDSLLQGASELTAFLARSLMTLRGKLKPQ